MTTLDELAARAQVALADTAASQWPLATIRLWLQEAIRPYGDALPRHLSLTLAITAGERRYDLPADFRDPLRVEYPPGRPLRYRDHSRGGFDGRHGLYDILRRGDATAADQLLLSESPAVDGTAVVQYTADHNFDPGPGDPLTVPARHHHILVNYVIWQAWRETLAREQRTPTSASALIMSQLAENTDRVERAYRRSLRDAIGERATSQTITWRGDHHDPIY